MVNKPRIIIADKSFPVMSGIKNIVLNIDKYEILKNTYNWNDVISLVNKSTADFLIFNPDLLPVDNYKSISSYFKNSTKIKIIAIYQNSIDNNVKVQCEAAININSNENHLIDQFKKVLLIDTKPHKKESSKLSKREESVVRCIALGMTNKEIADNLFISAHTVVTHRKNITRKLGIKTVSGLTVYAIINKLAKLEEIKN